MESNITMTQIKDHIVNFTPIRQLHIINTTIRIVYSFFHFFFFASNHLHKISLILLSCQFENVSFISLDLKRESNKEELVVDEKSLSEK